MFPSYLLQRLDSDDSLWPGCEVAEPPCCLVACWRVELPHGHSFLCARHAGMTLPLRADERAHVDRVRAFLDRVREAELRLLLDSHHHVAFLGDQESAAELMGEMRAYRTDLEILLHTKGMFPWHHIKEQ